MPMKILVHPQINNRRPGRCEGTRTAIYQRSAMQRSAMQRSATNLVRINFQSFTLHGAIVVDGCVWPRPIPIRRYCGDGLDLI